MKVYADYNATAPLRSQSRDAMLAAMDIGANPSSVHAGGRRAKGLLEQSRDVIAHAIGACRDEIVFTSGGTESNALALNGAVSVQSDLAVVASAIEHSAVLEQPAVGKTLAVDGHGQLDLHALAATLDAIKDEGRTPLASIMLANNETGVIQPVFEAAEMVHAAGGWVHCDGVQGLGKLDLSVIELDVDYLSLSSHKVGGPAGVGALWFRPNAPLAAQLTGGGQELGRRCGTENLIGIAGFAAAVEASLADRAWIETLSEKRDRFEARLLEAADVKIFGKGQKRLANTSNIGVKGFKSETQVMAMDLAGVMVSSGAACSSGKVKRSHVLKAMGVDDDLAECAVRFSFGWESTDAEIDFAAEAWIKAAQRAGVVSRA